MKTLHYFKNRGVEEINFDLPEPTEDQIQIETIYCGICRSDIGNYMGKEEMPYSNNEYPEGIIGTWGHEGIGIVVKVGDNLKNIYNVGDFVATCSDPAYSYYYNAKFEESVKIPELNKKYIIQPVSCAINIIEKTILTANNLKINSKKILLIGSGFMSLVIGRYLKIAASDCELFVLGSSLKKKWEELDYKMIDNIKDIHDNSFSIVIDLSSKSENFYELNRITKLEGLICYAATPYDKITTNFFENCWKCHTFIMPSPRNSNFREIMEKTVDLIESKKLITDDIWSKEYNRNDINDVIKGFNDGVERSNDYIRGYLNFSL